MNAAGNKRVIRVHYPLQNGRMVLRTDQDWNRNIEASKDAVGDDNFSFTIQTENPFVYFKPVIVDGEQLRWSVGDNFLALADAGKPRDIYPYFSETDTCSVCEVQTLVSSTNGDSLSFRVFLPPGYYENPLKTYPVLYMQDGQNLFFSDEAFGGEHWRMLETMAVLDSMYAIEQVIVVGIYPNSREHNYTSPGWESYGRFIVEQLKPTIDTNYRTDTKPQNTAVIGSSLGGVVSLYLAWEYPDVFGMAGCMSSTFGWRDDLFSRISNGSKRNIRIYLDSGWPADNFEVTRNMRALLDKKGYGSNNDLLYFAFPRAAHNEQFWAMRSHIPFQYFFQHKSGVAAC